MFNFRTDILRTDHVTFRYQNQYKSVTAVKDVTCTFHLGRCYAIVGKSGSGKTTLVSLLAGLELPTEGEVVFQAKSTAEIDCDAYRLNHTAVIYQNYNLFPRLTTLENVMYPLRLKKIPWRKARNVAKFHLKSVGILPSQFHRFPSHLSGGEQQRVAIARALAAGNQIILADEPTGNLDITNSEQITQILLRLAHQENRCVIIITHDLEIASQMDEVWTMRNGHLDNE